MRKSPMFIAVLFAATFILGIVWFFKTPSDSVMTLPSTDYGDEPVPDFAEIDNVKVKKQAFFEYLKPAVEAQNNYILKIREKLLSWEADITQSRELSAEVREELNFLIAEYNVDDTQTLQMQYTELLRKIDIIPPELVLVQSANESAWGTSRFAQEGYNFFGLWCFKEGCGFVPKRRNEGATHEVAKFDDLDRATYVYMRNLNRHPAYKQLRMIRKELRMQQQVITAMKLSEGLEKYSERGEEYIYELQQMLRVNEDLINP